MKKPDSLENQLKTIQSERNLARGSKIKTEGGAIKPGTAATPNADQVDECGSVAGVAELVASQRRHLRHFEATRQYQLVAMQSRLVGPVLVVVRVQECDGLLHSSRGMVPTYLRRVGAEHLPGLHGSTRPVDEFDLVGVVADTAHANAGDRRRLVDD
jgi:hypothetical protein